MVKQEEVSRKKLANKQQFFDKFHEIKQSFTNRVVERKEQESALKSIA